MSADPRSRAAYGEVVDAAGAAAPWLALVHGASQDRRVFSAQVEAFRDDYRLLLVDLPGHGRSARVPGPYGMEEYAAAVLAAVDAAGVEATHYWGTHTGAAVGLLLVARHPRRFRSLVLEGPVLPGVDMPSVVEGYGAARATARERGVAAARREWFEERAWFDVIRANPDRCRAAEHWSMVSSFPGAPWVDDARPRPVVPLGDALGAIRRPVLVMNGERDLADFIGVADVLERTLPVVERERVPEAGGFPLWEFPDRVNPRVRRFLREHP